MILAETFNTTLLHFWEHLPSPYPPQSESQGSPKTKFDPPVLPENATAGRPAHEVQSSRPARVAGGWASVLAQPCPLLAPGPGDLPHPRVCSVSLDHVRAVWRPARSDRGQSGRWARLPSAPSCPPLSIPADSSGTLPGRTPPLWVGQTLCQRTKSQR